MNCEYCDQNFKRDNCVSDGKYCVLESYSNLPQMYQPKQILEENLRHACMFRAGQKPEKYFKYLQKTLEYENDLPTKHDSELAMKAAGIDFEKIFKCVDETYNDEPHNTADNFYYRESSQMQTAFGHHLFPSLVINNQVYRGSLSPRNFMEAICAAYDTEPKACRIFLRKEGIKLTGHRGVSARFFFTFIFCLVCISFGMMAAYQRCLKADMD